jgi:hypothetical protein
MIVFFKNIPGDTLRGELTEFIKPALKGGFFSAKGEIKKIEFLKLRVADINLVEFHALVHIEPDAVALRVIKKLHGQRFRDKRITVRQYYTRSWQNDRRADSKAVSAAIKEKRNTPTRRRNLEIIEDSSIEFSSRKSFHRRF